MYNKKGFTLLELLLVMFIIGVLVAGILTTFGPAVRIRAYQTQIDTNLGILRTATAAFFQEQARRPNTIEDLVTSGFIQNDPSVEPGVSYLADDVGAVIGIRNTSPYLGGYVEIDAKGIRSTDGWQTAATGTGAGGTGQAYQIPAKSMKGLMTKAASSIAKAVNQYFAKYKKYPQSLQDLVSEGLLEKIPAMPGVEFTTDGTGNVVATRTEEPYKNAYVQIGKDGRVASSGFEEAIAREEAIVKANTEIPRDLTEAQKKDITEKRAELAKQAQAGSAGGLMKYVSLIIVGIVVYIVIKIASGYFKKEQ